MKAIDTLRSWWGEQQSKTEGTWLKKSCRNTFLVAQRNKVQWKDLLSGRGKQILGGIKLLENKNKHPSLSIGKSKSLTKPWEKPYLEEEVPGIDSTFTNIWTETIRLSCAGGATQAPSHTTPTHFNSAITVRAVQACRPTTSSPQFSNNTSVQCGPWIKCYMIMQPLVIKQLDFFWMNQGNLCLDPNDGSSGGKQNHRIYACS